MVTIKPSWYRNPTRSPGDRTEMDFQPPADALCGVRREQSARRRERSRDRWPFDKNRPYNTLVSGGCSIDSALSVPRCTHTVYINIYIPKYSTVKTLHQNRRSIAHEEACCISFMKAGMKRVFFTFPPLLQLLLLLLLLHYNYYYYYYYSCTIPCACKYTGWTNVFNRYSVLSVCKRKTRWLVYV